MRRLRATRCAGSLPTNRWSRSRWWSRWRILRIGSITGWGFCRRRRRMSVLSGIHPIAEALRSGNPIERILIAQGAGGPRMQEIIDLARRASIPVRFEPRNALERLAGSSAHQGVVALGAARKYADLEAVVE